MKKLLSTVLFIVLCSSGLLATDSMLNYAEPIGDSQYKTKSDGSKFYHYPIKCKSGKVGRVWVGESGSHDIYVTNMQNRVKTRVIKNANYDFRDKLPKVVKEYCQ